MLLWGLADRQGILEGLKTIVDDFSLTGSEVDERASDAPFGLIDHPRLDPDGIVFCGQADGDVGDLAHFQFRRQIELKEKPTKADVGDVHGIFNTDNLGCAMELKPWKRPSLTLDVYILFADIDHAYLIASLPKLSVFNYQRFSFVLSIGYHSFFRIAEV